MFSHTVMGCVCIYCSFIYLCTSLLLEFSIDIWYLCSFFFFPDLFQRLFRQDLLVASLFRNFLLAERIMRSANCSPISHPLLPATHQHHMWLVDLYFIRLSEIFISIILVLVSCNEGMHGIWLLKCVLCSFRY